MASNVEFLNAVRQVATQGYKDRIPTATQDNLKTVTEAIMEFPTNKNEFIDVLTNRVAQTKFMQKMYSNPYKFFKKGSVPYGESIESIFIDIIKGKAFKENFGDSEVSSLIGKENPGNVKVEYYTENIRNKYKLSISDVQLRKAFTSADGLQQLINSMMVAPLNSAEYDEFLICKKLLGTISMAERVMAGYEGLSDDHAKSIELTKAIKTEILKMGFLSNKYNSQGVMTFSKPEEIVVFVTPETKAMIDVELLSSAFNMSKAEINSRLVVIDEFMRQVLMTGGTGEDADKTKGDTVVDENTLAIIADQNLIQMYDTLNQTESFRNPDQLLTNTFVHRWLIAYGCGFANALKIRKVATQKE